MTCLLNLLRVVRRFLTGRCLEPGCEEPIIPFLAWCERHAAGPGLDDYEAR